VTVRVQGASQSFPPAVALYVTKLACELPELRGVPLALWDCTELARQLITDGVVDTISGDTVRRILASSQLKPWRQKMWLSPKVPRDAVFAASVTGICDLYTRALNKDEVVLCVDEKTNIQPRGRTAPTLPARSAQPVRVEHEYRRDGALNLFAAFDTRTGNVIGWSAPRKRAEEFIAFLDLLDVSLDPSIRSVHLVLDNLRVHKSKAVAAWLGQHPRFAFHFPPVHCSWMNQVEQWFSILARKALRRPDFEQLLALDRHIHRYIERWDRYAHPFNWSTGSVTKILAKCEPSVALLVAA
jgi:DDE superfamily endonuclease